MGNKTVTMLPEPIALVVDDEPLIRMDTADILADAGYHVIESASADEAFEILEKHSSLKLLFTDIQMPGASDGITLANRVGERWPHIRVIVASGAVVPAEGALPETSRFLSKPLDAEVVLQVLKDFNKS